MPSIDVPDMRPTTLMIGTRDRTALGSDLVSDELAAELGDYPTLGREAKRLAKRYSVAGCSAAGGGSGTGLDWGKIW